MVNLKQLLDNQLFCDISIQVLNETFQAHQVVLAAGGQYFRAMFSSAMYDVENKCISLHDITPSTFESLLNFMYTGGYSIKVKNRHQTQGKPLDIHLRINPYFFQG